MADDIRSERAPSFRIYFGRLLLFAIPVINVGAALLWLLAGKDEETKSFGKAALLVLLILTGIFLGMGLISYGYLTSALLEGG